MTKTLDLRHTERLETLVLHERTGKGKWRR